MFVGEVPPDRQAAYRSATEDVVAYYADRYGIQAPEFGLYIGVDVEAVRSVYAELGGINPETLGEGGRVSQTTGGTDALYLYGPFINRDSVNSLLIAHEYFHILQRELSDRKFIGTPRWLVEGSAVYESFLYRESYERYRDGAVVEGANYDGKLRDLDDNDEFQAHKGPGYSLGSLATKWLIDQAGTSAQADYWQLLDEHATWQDAFASAFGMTVDHFHDAFEEYRGALLSELPVGRVAGTVVGPESEAVQGIGVWVGSEGTYHSWFAETPPDGTFDLYVLDGTRTIKIYVMEGGFWRHVGWYGKGGFATDRSQVTTIEVDGADVTGIEIRLPADPEDLPEVRIPRVQGTMLGSDGEPNEGIGVWVWGGSTDNSKLGRTSADGTFDIPHQNGTFVIRVYSWKEAAWHLVGYYGEGGFTFDEEEATEIEIDGADLTGIEIRLPPRVRGTVLGADGQPAEGVAVWVYGGLGDNTGFAGISSDGTFDIYHENGRFFIRVYVLDAGAWRHVGWYGGESGFTADGPLITQIEIDGADVTGIEIRLPANPADLPTTE